MSYADTSTDGQSGAYSFSSSWWTPERVRLAGMAGIIGGVVLTAVAFIHNATGIDGIDTLAGRISSVSHSGMYALMIFSLLGVDFRYAASYGRLGRILAYVLGVGLAALIPVFPLMSFVFGEGWMLGEIVAGIAFVAIHLVASIFGIVLWRRTKGSRLAAGLFIAVIPAIIAVTILGALGIGGRLSIVAIEAPLYLGFAAFGYDLWRRNQSPVVAAAK